MGGKTPAQFGGLSGVPGHRKSLPARSPAKERARIGSRAASSSTVAECGGNRDLYPLVRRQQVEIDSQKAQIALKDERLTRWQYNARKRGLKKSDLEASLPEIDRGRTA